MVKCESCNNGLCEQKYENRGKCKDPDNCTCTCQEKASTTFWKGLASVAVGAAAFAGGVALTVTTGGLGAVGIAAAVGGGALTGAGATAAIHAFAKQFSGDRITGTEYVKDVAIGGAAGALTGPIGLGGASATTAITSTVGTEGVKQGAVQLGCNFAVGAASGAAVGLVQETVNVATDENSEFSVTNVLKNAALGAVTGGAGVVTGNVTNSIDPGFVRSATKVVVDTTSTVVIDAGTQLITEGEIDCKRLAVSAGARAATSAGYEAVASATSHAHGEKGALKDKPADEELLEKVGPAGRIEMSKAKKELEKVVSGKVTNELKKVMEATNIKKEFDRVFDEKKINEQERNQVNDDILKVKNDESISAEDRHNQMKSLLSEKDRLQKLWKKYNRFITKHQYNIPQPALVEKNITLHDESHLLQFASDSSDPDYDGETAIRI